MYEHTQRPRPGWSGRARTRRDCCRWPTLDRQPRPGLHDRHAGDAGPAAGSVDHPRPRLRDRDPRCLAQPGRRAGTPACGDPVRVLRRQVGPHHRLGDERADADRDGATSSAGTRAAAWRHGARSTCARSCGISSGRTDPRGTGSRSTRDRRRDRTPLRPGARCRQHLVAWPGLGHQRVRPRPPAHRRRAAPGRGPADRGLLDLPRAGRLRSCLGPRRRERLRATRLVRRRHHRRRPAHAGTGRARRRTSHGYRAYARPPSAPSPRRPGCRTAAAAC